MRFYTQAHAFYCGIDLHARWMYLCILDPIPCKNSMPLKSLEEEALLSDNLQQCTRFSTNSPFSSSPLRAGSTNINRRSSST